MKWFVQILLGLYQLHSNGYAHSDIKMTNICLKKEENGELVAKISDFSSIRVVAKVNDSDATKSYSTLTYFSPERFEVPAN